MIETMQNLSNMLELLCLNVQQNGDSLRIRESSIKYFKYEEDKLRQCSFYWGKAFIITNATHNS